MKMIEVLQLISEGKIKDQTTLKIYDPIDTLYTYTFNGKSKAFYSNTKYSEELSNYFEINDKFLNREVEMIEPKPKKYYLKLFDDDECSYIHYYYDKETDSVDYLIGAKVLIDNYQMTFNEKEIKNDKLLNFIAKHGIKQEIESD